MVSPLSSEILHGLKGPSFIAVPSISTARTALVYMHQLAATQHTRFLPRMLSNKVMLTLILCGECHKP
jgi:hypothetical protein